MNTLAHLLVDMLSTAPGLVPLYREHLVMHDELLPHVFMADITRWVADARAPGSEYGETARDLVAVIDSHLGSGDAEVREVIVVSFLENLERGVVAHEGVRAWFGPALRAAAARLDATRTNGSTRRNLLS